MEPESSLPCSQEPSTDPYPEPDESNPYHPISLRSILMLKKAVFWDVAPCRCGSNRRVGETYRLHLQGRRENRKTRGWRDSENSCERSSETSVNATSTRCHIPDDYFLHSHRRENLKSYILMLFTQLRLGLPSGIFPSGFLNILYTFLVSPIRVTCPANLILLDLIILIILGEECKLWSSLLDEGQSQDIKEPRVRHTIVRTV
jgi:hypothetical protein